MIKMKKKKNTLQIMMEINKTNIYYFSSAVLSSFHDLNLEFYYLSSEKIFMAIFAQFDKFTHI